MSTSHQSPCVASPDWAKHSRVVRILLVEDHEDTLRSMLRLLSGPQCIVVGAASMEEALLAAQGHCFDLLISDLGLPDASGLELMRQLKHQYGMVGIALSGYGMDEDVEQCREAGFAEHMTKPVDFRALRAAIARLTA